MAEHVCPVWLGYFLASPVRKLWQNPETILGPYVRTGMTVLDVGSAMGFFSIPLARMVGDAGKVVCVDMQDKMLQALVRRAAKAGVVARLEPHRCEATSLGLTSYAGAIDFALAFAMVHEVPDRRALFTELAACLTPAGQLLGLVLAATPTVSQSRAALLAKQ